MSMIGNTLLNEIIHEDKLFSPSQILEKLHEGVCFALKQGKDQEHSRDDGMDITVCCYDKEKNNLQISCANHQALIIRDGEPEVIEGDIYSIGGAFMDLPDVKYTDNTIDIEKGLTLYMFSDGYYDQFGGQDGSKYMVSRFKELLAKNSSLSMDEQQTSLEKEFEDWKGSNNQVDDVLVVGVRV